MEIEVAAEDDGSYPVSGGVMRGQFLGILLHHVFYMPRKQLYFLKKDGKKKLKRRHFVFDTRLLHFLVGKETIYRFQP